MTNVDDLEPPSLTLSHAQVALAWAELRALRHQLLANYQLELVEPSLLSVEREAVEARLAALDELLAVLEAHVDGTSADDRRTS